MLKENALFGTLPDGTQAKCYTLKSGPITAVVSDLGATLVKLFVPDRYGKTDDIVLGFDKPEQYIKSDTFFGATVGRYANRIAKGRFALGEKTYQMDCNDGENNLHSGFAFFKDRLWQVIRQEENAVTFGLHSPNGDQGFPGNADIQVTYTLEQGTTLRISYDAICDQDAVFNFTNHSYFNLAGHQHPQKAMGQILAMPARFFAVADGACIPTGELRSVENTAMDFRIPKAVGQDIEKQEEPLLLQRGYDHSFEVFANPCAILSDPDTGRTMAVSTDCPAVQLYSGNGINEKEGKDGISYGERSGVCLETQYYPDSLNKPQWAQPVTPAGKRYRSETTLTFGIEGV